MAQGVDLIHSSQDCLQACNNVSCGGWVWFSLCHCKKYQYIFSLAAYKAALLPSAIFPLAALQPIRQGPSTQTLSHLATTPINLNKATWRLFWQGQCNDQSIDVVSVPSISLSSVCLSISHPSAGFYTGFFEKGGKSSDAPTYQETVPITNALTARIRLWKKSRCF